MISSTLNTEPLRGRIKPVFEKQAWMSGSPIQNGNGSLKTLATYPDGKILEMGLVFPLGHGRGYYLARYKKDGSVDASFGDGGVIFGTPPDFGAQMETMLLELDGKILLAGRGVPTPVPIPGMPGMTTSEPWNYLVMRLLPDGSKDPSFGTNGVTLVNFKEFGECRDARVFSIAKDADGKIVAAGMVNGKGSVGSGTGSVGGQTSGYVGDFGVIRLNPDGKIDESFGTKGRAVTDLGVKRGPCDLMQGLTKDGCLRMISSVPPPSPPPPFGTMDCSTQEAKTDNFAHDVAYKVLVQRDGRIIAAGCTGPYSRDCAMSAMVRYNSDGTLDTSFGTDGKVLQDFTPFITTDTTPRPNAFVDMLQLPDDQILALPTIDRRFAAYGGWFDYTLHNLRMGGGFRDSGGGDQRLFRMSTIPSWGDWTETNRLLLAVYGSDGKLNPSFGEGGIEKIELDGGSEFTNVASSIALSPGGRIAIVGSSDRSTYKAYFLVDLWQIVPKK